MGKHLSLVEFAKNCITHKLTPEQYLSMLPVREACRVIALRRKWINKKRKKPIAGRHYGGASYHSWVRNHKYKLSGE